MKKSKFLKKAELLTANDLADYPLLEFVNDDELGETFVRPLTAKKVKTLSGRLVGLLVTLANGEKVWGLLGNVKVSNPRLNKHLITLSINFNGRWFHLARYHDAGRSVHGPAALAKFLQLPIDRVFPIKYDLSHLAMGEQDSLIGEFEAEPTEQLTEDEIIALCVP